MASFANIDNNDPTHINNRIRESRKDRDLSCMDICAISDLSIDDIQLIFDVTERFKEIGNEKFSLLKGATIFNAFFENSTRTRASFEVGGKKLGADTINISSSGTSIKKGESLHDTAQNLDAMRSNIIIIRTEYAGIPQFLAKHVGAAVISAGDGIHEHPTQGLLDAYTMYEHYGSLKNLKGKTILLIGDVSHSRVFCSTARICIKLGMNVRVAAPRTFIRPGFQEAFPEIEIFFDIEKALEGVDIVNPLRVQEERGGGKGLPTLREFSKTFGISEARFAMAKKDAILMSPGPVMRDIEVHSSLMAKEPSKILTQVENGLALRTGLQWLLADRLDGKVKQYTRI